jgi:hypothetical protein
MTPINWEFRGRATCPLHIGLITLPVVKEERVLLISATTGRGTEEGPKFRSELTHHVVSVWLQVTLQ